MQFLYVDALMAAAVAVMSVTIKNNGRAGWKNEALPTIWKPEETEKAARNFISIHPLLPK